MPNGSFFEVSCHWLDFNLEGAGCPLSVLNININAFVAQIFIARHLWDLGVELSSTLK